MRTTGTHAHCVMGRRRRRRARDEDDDVDMTSYGDVTRSSALLAYIELTPADRQLGVRVVGYVGGLTAVVGGLSGGLYVSQVLTGSAAARDARLQPGDKINSINGFRLGHLDNDDAFRLLTATVSRQLGSEHTVRLGIIRSRDVSVLRHWQRWTDDVTTTSVSQRPTSAMQFMTTRF